MIRRLIEIARTGLAAILLHPLRSVVIVCALMVMLVPFLVGVSLGKGIEADARLSLQAGGDLYISGTRFGRTVPVPTGVVTQIRDLEGVTRVVPRIVGRFVLGKDLTEVIVVAVPETHFPDAVHTVQGRLPATKAVNEFVVGSELARRLKLKTNSLVPPFYRSRSGERVSKVVGVFDSDISIWQSDVMFCTLKTAQHIFDQHHAVTDLVVYCRSGYSDVVRRSIRNQVGGSVLLSGDVTDLRVVSRDDLQQLLTEGTLRRGGIFNLHFVLVFTVGGLVLLVTSGHGLAERRREIGLLKATGWQTDEILIRSVVETGLLALGAVSLSVVVSFVWLRVFDARGIAGVFMHGVASGSAVSIPFRLAPVPVLLALVVSLSVALTGTLWTTWKSAMASPGEAIR